ncbi:hypothetical protein ACHQM5_003364 [Ranunculus cassubicifolius]
MRTGLEAAEYASERQRLVRFLGVSNGNIQEGSLRCDVNVSVRPVAQSEFGTKQCIEQSITRSPGKFFFTVKARLIKLYKKLDFGKKEHRLKEWWTQQGLQVEYNFILSCKYVDFGMSTLCYMLMKLMKCRSRRWNSDSLSSIIALDYLDG